jgi:hypothetical protein
VIGGERAARQEPQVSVGADDGIPSDRARAARTLSRAGSLGRAGCQPFRPRR